VEVLIGVDPHSRRPTSSRREIDEQGEVLGQQTFPANRKGLRALQRSKLNASRSGAGRWRAQEEASDALWHTEAPLAAGERVVDVPPKLSSRVRVLSSGNARKNDALDATFIALAALRNDRLWRRFSPRTIRKATPRSLEALLTERREELVSERTRALNRLHVLLLRDLLLLCDPVRKQLSTDAAAKLLRRARPKYPAGRIRRRLAAELVRDVRALGTGG
jgi:transposase